MYYTAWFNKFFLPMLLLLWTKSNCYLVCWCCGFFEFIVYAFIQNSWYFFNVVFIFIVCYCKHVWVCVCVCVVIVVSNTVFFLCFSRSLEYICVIFTSTFMNAWFWYSHWFFQWCTMIKRYIFISSLPLTLHLTLSMKWKPVLLAILSIHLFADFIPFFFAFFVLIIVFFIIVSNNWSNRKMKKAKHRHAHKHGHEASVCT